MSRARFDASIILGFKGLNIFRRFSTVNVTSSDGLQKVRSYLQRGRSVHISFDGSLEPVKARYIDFLSGLSYYFDATIITK